MICKHCSKPMSIKETEEFISILCKCGIIIVYPDKVTKQISKKEYEQNKNKKIRNKR